MPQIWPMNWVMLFIYFLFIFIIFMVLVYFIVNTFFSPSLEKKNFKQPSLIWKW